MIRMWILFGVLTVLLCGCISPVVLRTDFLKDPLNSGWTYKLRKDKVQKPARTLADGESYISATQGATWTSPTFECAPFHFYRMTFNSIAESAGYWAIFFYDKDGELLAADDYSSIYPSREWIENDVIFRCLENATVATVNFMGIAGVIKMDDVRIEPINRNTAREWADDLYKTVQPLEYIPDEGRWRLIPKTIEHLKTGSPIRIVMLGHSIMNDISNSTYEALIERMYPKARIKVVPSVRGETGCDYFQKDKHITSYVVDRKPDLLMILGIGTNEEIRQVIHKAARRSRCEILLVSCPTYPNRIPSNSGQGDEQMEKFIREISNYSDRLKNLAEDEKIEYLDMAKITLDYYADLHKPQGWFQRDRVHANDRGKQVLARILERYFAPKNGE